MNNTIPGKNIKRLYHNDIPIPFRYYPIDINRFNKILHSQAPKMSALWESYYGKYCKFMIVDTNESKTLYDEQKFPTKELLINFINANCSGRQIVIYVYEEIDERIPPLTKCYGINRLLSILKGIKKYKKGSNDTHTGVGTNAANKSYDSQMYNLFALIFKTFDGTLTLTATSFSNVLASQSIWLPRLEKTFFSELKINNTFFYAENPVSRSYFNKSTGIFVALTPSDRNWNVTNYCYVAYKKGSFYSVAKRGSGGRVSVLRLLAKGWADTIGIAYWITNGTKYAVLLKPIAIDHFLLNYVDRSKYDVEMVEFMDEKQTYANIEVISPIKEDAEYGKAMYDDLVGMLSISKTLMRRGRKSVKRVFRLRVREIATGRVSEFSKFKIVAEKPEVNSIIPFYLKVKSED